MNKIPFTTIYENFVNRYNQGGFLPGDYVTLTKDALNCKELSKQHKELVKQLVASGERIRVVNIQAKNNALVGLPSGTAENYYVVLAPEISPGLNGGTFVVPMTCVELETPWDEAPQKPFDDKFERKNNHQDNLEKNVKFSDIYDSGKGTQEDFGKK